MRQAPRPNGYRDAWCGQLTADRAGTAARVAGWVHRRRDHGGLIFIDLRDRSGLVQLVFHPETAQEAHARAHSLRAEDVLSARGEVTRRDPENVNPNLTTGEIEVAVEELEILADAETPPFPLEQGDDAFQVRGNLGAPGGDARKRRRVALRALEPPLGVCPRGEGRIELQDDFARRAIGIEIVNFH